ncbi:hypothetical protein EBU94_03575 [bacterium]|nr:hypothetical protein [bacterium]
MFIIGSSALKKRISHSNRSVKDTDVVGTHRELNYLVDLLSPKEVRLNEHNCAILKRIKNKNEFFQTDNVEFFISDDKQSLTEYTKYENIEEFKVGYASLETLYSLKKSHIHFPLKFKKHIQDYCELHNEVGGTDNLSNITKIGFSEAESRLGKLRTPSLNKKVSTFFDQSKKFVDYFFIHDDIHRVMAHYDSPLYERMQSNKELAKCEVSLWNDFSFEDKCKCVLEEAYVIALERKIIPVMFGSSNDFTTPQQALEWSMMRICTTLCGGWFREFATNNYKEIMSMSDPKYLDKFMESVKLKKINMI